MSKCAVPEMRSAGLSGTERKLGKVSRLAKQRTVTAGDVESFNRFAGDGRRHDRRDSETSYQRSTDAWESAAR